MWVLKQNPEAKLQSAEFYTFTCWFRSAVCRSGGLEARLAQISSIDLVFYTSCEYLSFNLPPRYSLIGEKRSTCQTFHRVEQVRKLSPTWADGRFYQLKSKFTSFSAACPSALIGRNLTWFRQSFCHVTTCEEAGRGSEGSAMMSLFICHVFLLQHEFRHASIRTQSSDTSIIKLKIW